MRFSFLLFVFFCATLRGQRTDFDKIDFKKADSIATLLKGESLKNLPVLTHKLTAGLTSDVEKFRAIYTWVSTTIENDYSSYRRTSKKRKKLVENREAFLEWNTSYTPKVFKTLMQQKKAACTGYAYLMRELANLAGIDCKIIDGYGRTANVHLTDKSPPNHSWNAVKLNDKWYLCDATWSAGIVVFEKGEPRFKSEYHDGYFLADPRLFVKNHYPLQVDWALLSEPPTFSQFLEGPIVYKEAFKPTIIPISPSKMRFDAIKNEPISFTLALADTIKRKNISLVLNKGGNDKSIEPEITMNQNTCTLRHNFDTTGTYDVHITLNGTIITTYVVKVRRK